MSDDSNAGDPKDKRGRGRPRLNPDRALTPAEKQRRYRERIAQQALQLGSDVLGQASRQVLLHDLMRQLAEIDGAHDEKQRARARQVVAPVVREMVTRYQIELADETAEQLRIHALEDRVQELKGELTQAHLERSRLLEQRDQASTGISQVDARQLRLNRYLPPLVSTTAFEDLKRHIAHAGGNLVPVLAKPTLEGLELVYGRKRLQACLELGLPVQVIEHPLNEQEALRVMVAEGRSTWSIVELGWALDQALQAGLSPSTRRLAELVALEIDQASLALRAARLPKEVIAAFDGGATLKPEYVGALVAALERDPDHVLQTARSLAGQKLPTSKVKAALVKPRAG